ncbi:hypothetical protein GP486_001575 [Trichoglossum hirsutum]|uniref:BTB domain-containing protein n=1 Tax=Trichoglossum hirsutum TaxID=265104 RepID=A0A9P8RSK1_9PEZI|nr:hypothetical protein GP486_001575 [Trichoglossum hirsutum]
MSRRLDLSSAATSKPKKRKHDSLLFTDHTVITVKVGIGEDASTFGVHKELLCSHSVTLNERLNSPTLDPLTLETSTEVFQTFLNWLYSKVLVVDGLDDSDNEGDGNENAGGRTSNVSVIAVGKKRRRDSGSSTENSNNLKRFCWYSGLDKCEQVFGRLLDLYVFGDTYDILSFKTDVIFEWQRFIISARVPPCPIIVNQALDRLDIESPLCRLLIDCYGSYTDYLRVDKGYLATLPPIFLVEVLLIALRHVEGDYDEDWEENWCIYHEHRDREEKDACRKRWDEEEDE